MTSQAKQDQLRSFRKQDATNKNQGSILRFVRRTPGNDNTTAENGIGSSPSSPKISTIVVRKPSSIITFRKNVASTTAQAFNTFNSSKLFKQETDQSTEEPWESSPSNSDIVSSCGGGASSSCSSPVMDRAISNGNTSSKMLYIGGSPVAEHRNGLDDTSSADLSLQESPVIRVKVLKKVRIIESDESDSECPPVKKIKCDPDDPGDSKQSNVLCRDYDEAPENVDKYLDTLASLYPGYDKMELQDILRSWKYNFSETSCYLEKEKQRLKDLRQQKTKEDCVERLRLMIEEKKELARLQTELDEERAEAAVVNSKEREKLLEERAAERLRMVLARQAERQRLLEAKQTERKQAIDRKLMEKKRKTEEDQQRKQDKEQSNDSRKILHREKIQKRKMFKMLGASSRMQQIDIDDDDDEVYIGKNNVYVSDDSEGEDDPKTITNDVITMRNVVMSFLNEATDREILAIPNCNKKKADVILAKRPFSNWDHLVRVFKTEKNITPEMLNNVKNVLQKRSSVNQLMKKCEHISADIQNTVACLMEGGESEAAISTQPKILNPAMTLKGYQMIGLNWLALMHQHGLNSVLADEMGLGKTVQAIAFLAHILETENPDELSLIVVPSSTLDNWARELETWCPSMGVLMYHGSQEERRGMALQIVNNQISEDLHVILTTYNMVYSCPEDRVLFKRIKLKTVIFDEAHMLKNMNSHRFENLMKISAEYRILLTGTPLQNNLVELMSILVFVMPQLFDSRKEELKQVFAMFPKSDDRDKGQYESTRIEQAKRIMKPFFLRRLKVDVLKDLPPKHERVINVVMPEQQRTLYDQVVTALSKKATEMRNMIDNMRMSDLNEIEQLACDGGQPVKKKKKKPDPSKVVDEGDGVAGGGNPAEREESSANILMTLRRLANHPLLHRKQYSDEIIAELAKILKNTSHRESILSYIIEDFAIMSDYEIHQTCAMYPAIQQYRLDQSHVLLSGKFEQFDELLPPMKERGDRVLIFSQFVIVLNIIEEYMNIRGHKFVRLDGQTPIYERQEMIDEFNESPDIFVFLLSTRAGGLGINLTSANTVILHDIDFNPYNDKQAEDRCHRVGQTRPVTVIRLVTMDSIEEGIRAIALSKLDLEREVTDLKDDKQKKVDMVSLLKAALGLVKPEERGSEEEAAVTAPPASDI